MPRAAVQRLRQLIAEERQRLHAERSGDRIDDFDLESAEACPRGRAQVRERQAPRDRRRVSPWPGARRPPRANGCGAAIENAAGIYLPDRLHEVRIAVKKLRYAIELVQRCPPHARPESAQRLRALKTRAGSPRTHARPRSADRAHARRAELAGRVDPAAVRRSRSARPPARNGVPPATRSLHGVARCSCSRCATALTLHREPRDACATTSVGLGRMEPCELYLVRHAIAAERGDEWPDDTKRPLTERGISRFKEVVEGLRRLDVEIDEIFTSPLVRARQTADLLAAGLANKAVVKTLDALAPGHAPRAVMTSSRKAASAGASRWSDTSPDSASWPRI